MSTPTEPDTSSLLTVRQAIDILDGEAVKPRVERRPLAQCRGLRLAQDLIADRDYPPFDKALMDGYAIRAADVKTTPIELPVVGEVPAGMPAERPLGEREAIAVMTGAPLPAFADCVVPVEQTEEIPDPEDMRGRVRILKGVSANYAIGRRGSDVMAGQVVLSKGTVLHAPAIAVAASIGAGEVDVFTRPRVAVLGTGDELVPVGEQPAEWQIRNSNNLMLVALLEQLGAEVTDLGIVRDDPDAIREGISGGLSYDCLFITGGMSMGAYDYVPAAMQSLGVELKVTKVRVKPGKPFVFGVKSNTAGDDRSGATFVFGLPGNPVSAFVCTLRLASRILARLGGGIPQERWLTGRLDAGLPANGPREFYQPVIRKGPTGHKSAQNELPAIEMLNWRGSADVFTLARANALLVRAENEPALPKGTMVRVLEI